MDIVVTFPQGDINHWNDKVTYSYIASQEVWWDMKRLPKQFTIQDKMFVVMEGKVRGFFEIKDIEMLEETNKVYLMNFQDIELISMKGFQGFRYRKFDYEIL